MPFEISSSVASGTPPPLLMQWRDMVPAAWLEIENPRDLTPREIAALAVHWTELDGRPSANLSWDELACNRTGKVYFWKPMVDLFETIREAMGGHPITINSAYRHPAYNSTIKNASNNSPHMYGLALDCSMANHDPHLFADLAEQFGATGIGRYPPDAKRRKYRGNFIHIDLFGLNMRGDVRRWGEPFSVREVGNRHQGDDGGRERAKQDSLDKVVEGTIVAGTAGTAATVEAPSLEEVISPREAVEEVFWATEAIEQLLTFSPYMIAAIALGGVLIYWRWLEYHVGTVFEGVSTWCSSLISSLLSRRL
ncbi:MAG: D-Ala-D-Ala carboxypeptidase family metallohydrolase [Pseudomonadota bacterium]